MKPYELESSLNKGGPASLYLIVGEEDYLRDEAMAAIRTMTLEGGGVEGFNHDLLYGDECGASDILACARDIPAFAPRRLVVVKTAEKISAREWEALIPYIKAPTDSTTVVFSASKLDGRLKSSQTLKQHATVVDCARLPAQQVPSWVRTQAGQLGLRMSEDAILLMAELAGHSLYLVRRELEKLAVSVPEGTLVGVAEVEAARGSEPGASVFDLSEAIGARDSGRALRILARNMEVGEEPLRIFGALVWQYRRLWKARALLGGGSPEKDVGRSLGIPPYRLREFLEGLGRFSESHLRNAFQLFLETDSALKGGRATTPKMVMEHLLLRLCLGGQDATQRQAQRTDAQAVKAQPSKSAKTKPIRNVRTIRSGRPISN